VHEIKAHLLIKKMSSRFNFLACRDELLPSSGLPRRIYEEKASA
jgi:hypothetical protein